MPACFGFVCFGCGCGVASEVRHTPALDRVAHNIIAATHNVAQLRVWSEQQQVNHLLVTQWRLHKHAVRWDCCLRTHVQTCCCPRFLQAVALCLSLVLPLVLPPPLLLLLSDRQLLPLQHLLHDSTCRSGHGRNTATDPGAGCGGEQRPQR